LRWYGIDREDNRKDSRIENDVPEWGYKFHMNDVAATIGIEQLKYLKGILAKNRRNSKFLDNNFKKLQTVKICSYKKDRNSARWLYTILVKNRQNFFDFMKDANIMVSQVHGRNDTHTMFKDFRADLPATDEFTKNMCCIPSGWWLTENELQYIANKIREWDKINRSTI
jgi:dTDP-4-amino-4,6-dideoxygalactose transaminase